MGWVSAAFGLGIWMYLLLGRGWFWRTDVTLPDVPAPARWPSVTAVIPARDEAAVLPRTLPSVLAQDYPGPFRVIVVDDQSTDGTAAVARFAGAEVIEAAGPPAGWVGKVAAMADGVGAAGATDYVLFTDADIEYPADGLRRLVALAVQRRSVLTSQMVRLRADSGWERLLIPAFVYFFAQLYPFRWVNRGGSAAAAGGCMLVERAALERAGGMAAVRNAVIDDVSLARALRGTGPLWLGLSGDVHSVRPYSGLAEVWRMVARSAYTQLRYSPVLLAGTVAGLLVTYLLPPVTTVTAAALGCWGVASIAAAAWLIMTASFVPMLRFYRLTPLRALLLPGIAALYLAMTLDSARRHRAGRGAEWKGRVASHG